MQPGTVAAFGAQVSSRRPSPVRKLTVMVLPSMSATVASVVTP
ncbi:hypothetical protein [Dactylosporangium darangshiense]